ncbi:TolC family outer membrane protein [Asticcacaulis tiandongensis]|uniref:TolC family outer membrane protein n=1 Tax=Asticcacaulis tiandongensis TaxID=2565365 RepID=UPI001128E8C3|nr:TolC family outer membrane protein [Asticcacaulis tiandongensis]
MQGARHNRLKFKWQGALSLLALMSAMAVSPVNAESLADAIAQAYAQNPTLQRARALQRANDENYVQARSGLGPSLSLGADIGYQDPGLQGTKSTTGLSLSASQPLFSSGGLTSGLNAAEADVRAGQEDLRTIESQVLLQVIDVYTAVRRDQEALRIQQESYAVLNQQLEETRARFEVGELTRTDVAQSEARLAAASAAVSAAQAKLDASRAAYVAIVGQSPVALDPAPALQVPNDFTQALNRAENNNPSLRAAQYSEAAARSRVSQARSGLGPNVGLTASYGVNAPTNDFRDLGSRDVATAGIRVTVPLFTSGLNSSRVRQASENYNAQRISVELSRREVVQQTATNWGNMNAARAGASANREQVRAASVAAEGVRLEQGVGLRTNIEVLNAEQELRQAQLALIDAERSEYLASAQLLAVTGDLRADALVAGIETYDPAANFDAVKNKGATPLEPLIRAVDGLVVSGE